MSSPPRLVILGAGTLGLRVARLGRQAGSPVLAVTATPTRHPALEELGCEPRLAGEVIDWQPGDRVLFSVPGAAAQLDALAGLPPGPPPERAVHVSSTGIYGDPEGRVDEESPLGTSPRAQGLAQAERASAERFGPATIHLRSGGLFAPGRGPFPAFARHRRLPLDKLHRRLALIRYDSLAEACVRAMTEELALERVYIAVEHQPVRLEFYRAACAALDHAAPELEGIVVPAEASPHYDTTRFQRDLAPSPQASDWKGALR